MTLTDFERSTFFFLHKFFLSKVVAKHLHVCVCVVQLIFSKNRLLFSC